MLGLYGRVTGGWFALATPLWKVSAAVLHWNRISKFYLPTLPPEKGQLLVGNWHLHSDDYENPIDTSKLRVAPLTSANDNYSGLILRSVEGTKVHDISNEARTQCGLKVAEYNIFERIGNLAGSLSIVGRGKVRSKASFSGEPTALIII